MSAVMNLWIPQKARKLSAIWATISFSRGTCSVMLDKAETSFRTWDRPSNLGREGRCVVLMTECYMGIACWPVSSHLRICSLFLLFWNLGVFFIHRFLCMYTWEQWLLPHQVVHICCGQVCNDIWIQFYAFHFVIMMWYLLTTFCALFLMCLCFDFKSCFWYP
jgi:hypothetical protein